jgi:site-specific DNA-methyltransferase (adenine-specific)/adenine-specific DNA-methyltransferase
LHCDPTRGHYIKIILDEIFGQNNFRAEITWKKTTKTTSFKNYGSEHDLILVYSKTDDYTFNQAYKPLKESELKSKYIYFEKENAEIIKLTKEQKEGKNLPKGRRFRGVPLLNMNQNRPNLRYEFLGHTKVWAGSKEKLEKMLADNLIFQIDGGVPSKKGYLDENLGAKVNDVWDDISAVNSQAKEKVHYPTQKPEALLKRIIEVSSNPGDLVFDCFMGSGTTQNVALKNGRRFIGSDINLGSIETTIMRLNNSIKHSQNKLCGFEVYNVNNYDVFRNPVQAKEILRQALEIQPLPNNTLYDGEKDGRMVKIMPVNRIATRADLNELISGFNIKSFEKKFEASPNKPVESLLLVCMGHEPDLAASLQKEMHPYKLDVEVVDILRDKSNLEFKRDSEAEVVKERDKLVIREFYPMNLLQKLSLMKENVENWKELTESVKVDFNYDGVVFEPSVVDVPEKNELVSGEYKVPEDAGTIRIKITDLLSESLELTIENNN